MWRTILRPRGDEKREKKRAGNKAQWYPTGLLPEEDRDSDQRCEATPRAYSTFKTASSPKGGTLSSLPCPWMWETSRPSFRRRTTAPNWKSKASLRAEKNKAGFQQQRPTGQMSTWLSAALVNVHVLEEKSPGFSHALLRLAAKAATAKGTLLSVLSHLIKVE